jgi:predicted permease
MFQDLRFGARMLLKSKGLTLVAVLSLALGIGANTAIFTLMDAVLLKMLPVRNPTELFFLEKSGVSVTTKGARNLSYSIFSKIRERSDLFAGVCAVGAFPRVNIAVDGQAEIAHLQPVSGSFYTVLGVSALLGRTINDDDDSAPGQHPVVVISHRYWQRRFASDPAVVGRKIALNGHPFTIIGVTAPEFFGVTVGESPDLWAPAMMYTQIFPGSTIDQYFNRPLNYVLARLKPGISEQQATVKLTGILHESLADESGSQVSPEKLRAIRQQGIALISASHGLSSLRAQFSEPLRILMAVVGLVLLIACANVANLLLARAAARQKELVVRSALGASRARLVRQLLTESLLLALTGGLAGLLFAWWGSRFLLALVGSGHNPIALELAIDARVLGFAAAVSLLTSILFGLVPALRATRGDLNPALNSAAAWASSGARTGLRKTLVVAQVALSLLLLICAGLFVRSLTKLRDVDSGLEQRNVLLFSTDPRLIGYQGKQIAQLYDHLLERLNALPGVHSASLSRQALISGGGTSGRVYLQGQPQRSDENNVTQQGEEAFCQVGPAYFETVGMTILRGRSLTSQDDENGPRVAVVNETFARAFLGNDDPLGKRFGFSPENSDKIEIVGVVKDAKYNDLREEMLRTFYIPYKQDPSAWRETTFQIRTGADPASLIASVRQAAREVDANLPLFNVKTLATQVDESLVEERLIGILSSFFGLLALLLASIGIYGVMGYAVSQRTREIGIRMALGAPHRNVMLMVLRQGMKLVWIGVGVGIAVSLAVTRLITSQLYGVTPTDFMTFSFVSLMLLMVALLACFIPARRATQVDPLVALRTE